MLETTSLKFAKSFSSLRAWSDVSIVFSHGIIIQLQSLHVQVDILLVEEIK